MLYLPCVVGLQHGSPRLTSLLHAVAPHVVHLYIPQYSIILWEWLECNFHRIWFIILMREAGWLYKLDNMFCSYWDASITPTAVYSPIMYYTVMLWCFEFVYGLILICWFACNIIWYVFIVCSLREHFGMPNSTILNKCESHAGPMAQCMLKKNQSL